MTEAETAPKGSATIQRSTEKSKPHIMVVEDDEFLRDLLTKKLTQEGFLVTTAEDGNTGMRKLRQEIPQLILLDLILPGMDGFAILKYIRASEQLRDIPVVVLSNLGQREDVQRALKLGANDYLVKAQFTPAEILKKLKHLLRNRYVG